MPSVKKNYKQSDAEYAAMYNISSSSIFRYKKEYAPLDNPEKFAQWIAARPHKPKSFRMPGGLRGHRVTEHIRRKVFTPAAEVADDSAHQPSTKRETIEGTGLRVEIARQEAECAHAYRRYKEAEEGGETLDALAYHKVWVAAQKSLRELSKDVPKSEQDDAKVIAVGAVENSWTTALADISTQLNSLGASVSLGLVAVEPDVRLQVEKAIDVEVAAIIENFQQAPWLKHQ